MPATKRFKITYEIVTEDSAYGGDAAYRGFLPKSATIPTNRNNMPKRPALFTLREAWDLVRDLVRGQSTPEMDSYPCSCPRWITVQTTRDWELPSVSLSLHLDNACSRSSARRVARLFGCRLTR